MDIVLFLLLALLFGGMGAFSFGFAVLMFKVFPKEQARGAIRGAFPHYYAAVIGLSAVCAALAVLISLPVALVCAGVAVTTVYARQVLMHQINAATDRGDKGAFGRLHGLSVVVQLAQIGAVGWAMVLLAA